MCFVFCVCACANISKKIKKRKQRMNLWGLGALYVDKLMQNQQKRYHFEVLPWSKLASGTLRAPRPSEDFPSSENRGKKKRQKWVAFFRSLGTGTPPLRRWCSSSHSLRFTARKLVGGSVRQKCLVRASTLDPEGSLCCCPVMNLFGNQM